MNRFMLLLSIGLLVSCAGLNDREYGLVNIHSLGMAVRGYAGDKIGGGFFDTNYDKIKKTKALKVFSQSECIEQTKLKLREHKKFNITIKYLGNGIYNIDGTYARYICVDIKNIKDNMKNITAFSASITKEFFETYSTEIPSTFTESEFKNYTIFPLDEDQKEAKRLTEEMDKELSDAGVKIDGIE